MDVSTSPTLRYGAFGIVIVALAAVASIAAPAPFDVAGPASTAVRSNAQTNSPTANAKETGQLQRVDPSIPSGGEVVARSPAVVTVTGAPAL